MAILNKIKSQPKAIKEPKVKVKTYIYVPFNSLIPQLLNLRHVKTSVSNGRGSRVEGAGAGTEGAGASKRCGCG